MVISMEVKGHLRSNMVNYVLWLPYIWSKEFLMQAKNDDDLHGGQRSAEVIIINYLWLPSLARRAVDASLGGPWFSRRPKVNRGQIQWTIYALSIWYLVSRGGLRPKVCMHYFGFGMNWIKEILHDFEEKMKHFNFQFLGDAFLNIVILYFLLMRREVLFENHLVMLWNGSFTRIYIYILGDKNYVKK